ncbi:phosphatase PAP2 family protein [Oerskovia jenensis]|uniref:Undecaprenyl-diphosphatase n=1 Tax=Oerskovia jenensis TaxID=162169 RepID=A0ABS2LH65_9CELL|nr:phosphatase PAP2 family protein [Oerskovia jenensis]MBM7479761.1 undecaprenyl-diphosphatase [Oerskovia jenensis]
MHPFVHRYELDTTRPTRREVARDLALRAFLPGVALWVVIVGLGFLIKGPLDNLPGEAGVNQALVDLRTPFLDNVTEMLSAIGMTEFIIGACVLAVALIWWRTRQWWFALVPALAVSLQALIFLTSSLVVGRTRPEVDMLDHAPPTSSFPSGHTGASTAFYLTLALLAQRVQNPALRVVLTVLAVLVPFAVGFARLYRGMHSLTDVLAGLVNGVVCAVLAWGYLRRDTSRVRA